MAEAHAAQATADVQGATSTAADVASGRRRGPRLPRLPARYFAVAVGTMLLFFAFIAANYVSDPKTPHLVALIPAIATTAGLATLIAASVRFPTLVSRRGIDIYRRAHPLALGLTGLLAASGAFALLLCVTSALALPAITLYDRDVISFTHVNAQLILSGHNPYTSDSVFLHALRSYPDASPTPIRNAAFGPGFDYPSRNVIDSVLHRYLASPASVAGAFDPRTLHSYPALAYLLYVPALVLRLPNILVIHLVVLAALYAWLIRVAPPTSRRWTLVLAAASITVPFGSLLFDTEIICIALLLPAWHYRGRPYLSPVLLGLACAFKQFSWFFVPFFLLDALLAHGWREAGRRSLVALGAFLLPNLPFLIASPGAWFQSLGLPLTDPMYPLGIGAIVLARGHLLPYLPPALYVVLELVALGACLWLASRWRARLGFGVLLLALVPLFFAFRSPADYFSFAPVLALYAVNSVGAGKSSPTTPASSDALSRKYHRDQSVLRVRGIRPAQ